ncbi:MAG: TetR/AcrR family transcriptional regulator [Deltaproteobacteria bacterium]|nr:TetR/AcrR family transcriptional regulator [Deltaproteobacteria bacterium]
MTTEFRRQADRQRKERRREVLLDAAAVVIGRQGYHRTLVSEIVAEAGSGQGTFYRYFRDKREVFDALLDRFVETVLGQFSEMSVNLPRNAREYRDASVAAIQRIAAAAERDRALVRRLVQEGPAVDAAFERKLAGVQDRLAGLAQFYLDHAVRSGFARPCNTAVVSRAVIGMAFAGVQQWMDGRYEELPLERLIEEMVDFAFHGFGAPVGDGGGGAS